MTTTSTAPANQSTRVPISAWGVLAFLGVLWLLVFNQLRFEWSVNPVYSYGWAIPFLAGYLFWERWNRRPAPQPSAAGPFRYLLPALLLLSFLPVRVLQESNPDWILIHWSLAAIASGSTFWALFHFGGKAWLRHFLFPVLFVFTAVPWPVGLENLVLQGLMQVNAIVAAEALSLCGMPAFVHGNLIFVGNELVGVDEACSGIRSLQTAFMMSLFLGEFYLLRLLSRVLLVLFSFLLAFLFNLGRTLTLTYIGGTQGAAALENWHDPLGFAVLGLCIFGLWLLALAFHRRRGREAAEKEAQPVLPGAFPGLRPVSAVFLLAGGAWLLASEVATETWYRLREGNLIARPDWSVEWRQESAEFRAHEFSDTTRTILKFNEGSSASWTSSEGDLWSAYYLRWYPGRVSRYLSTAHNPEICLPAAGMQLEADLGLIHLEVHGLSMPFRTYRFTSGSRDHYVFHSLLEDRHPIDETSLDSRHLDRNTRLHAAWHGRRNLGQRVVGISINGPRSLDEAEGALRRGLESILRLPEAPAQFPSDSAD